MLADLDKRTADKHKEHAELERAMMEMKSDTEIAESDWFKQWLKITMSAK